MLYPVYIHMGDPKHAHGVTFPDFAGEEGPIPLPTALEKLVSDPVYQGGVWMLAEIDITRVRSRPVRLNISLPERPVHQIDEAAKARHLTRSGFLAQAALKEMARP